MKNLQLYFGEEKLLIEDEIQKLKTELVPEHLEVVNYVALDGQEVSEEQIINAMNTVPMMASHKLVVVKDARFFDGGSRNKDSEISENFFDFLRRLPDHTITVFTCDKPDKRKRLYKLFQKQGIIKDFSKPSPKMKAQWIQRRARAYGKALELSAAYYIGEYTTSLLQADSELKKIVAYVEGDKIRREEVIPIFSQSLEANIFKLTDYIGEKKAALAMDIYVELTMRGEKGIVILYMISKHLMDLVSVKSLAGKNPDEMRKALDLHPFVVKKALEQSKNFTLEELKEAVRLCQDTDLNIKTGRFDEKLGIELLITRISS